MSSRKTTRKYHLPCFATIINWRFVNSICDIFLMFDLCVSIQRNQTTVGSVLSTLYDIMLVLGALVAMNLLTKSSTSFRFTSNDICSIHEIDIFTRFELLSIRIFHFCGMDLYSFCRTAVALLYPKLSTLIVINLF